MIIILLVNLTVCLPQRSILKNFIVGASTDRGSEAVPKPDVDSKRKASDGSVNSFDLGESEAAAEEGGEWLSSKIEVDEDEIKIDVKVEDMLGDLSWYFNDSSAKGKSESRRASKGSRRASKAEPEKEKEEREENGSDE